jgi:hypothetical protein
MEKYEVPSEYADFVSSAQLLTEELKVENEQEDIVSYQIYFRPDDGVPSNDEAIEDLIQQARRLAPLLERLITVLVKDYIWNLDPFTLKLVIPDSKDDVLHFEGELRTGGNVEDGWFTVFLLQKLTQAFPTLACAVKDNDGEFLLIEAADMLPSWLGPHNCENRVWIINGQVIIIGVEDVSSRQKSFAGVPLRSALNWIWGTYTTTMSDSIEAVRRCINKRTINVYPSKISAVQHQAVCLIPLTVARALNAYPQLLSYASAAFCTTPSKDSKKPLSSLSIISRKSKISFAVDSGACMGHSITDSGLEDLVATTVKFTKVIFAQLTFKKFSIPKAFHPSWRSLGAKLGLMNANSGPDSKMRQAFELGCRVSCGLELAYHKCQSLHRNQFSGGIIISDPVKQSNSRNSCMETVMNFRVTPTLCMHLRTAYDSVVHSVNAPSGLLDVSAENKLSITRFVECSGDSTDWLYLSPEQLEQYIQKQIEQHKPPHDDVATSMQKITLDESLEQGADDTINNLDTLVSSVKNFMEGSSDIRGVSTTSVGQSRSEAGSGGKTSTSCVSLESILTRSEIKHTTALPWDGLPDSLSCDVITSLVDSVVAGKPDSLVITEICRAVARRAGVALEGDDERNVDGGMRTDASLSNYFYSEDLDMTVPENISSVTVNHRDAYGFGVAGFGSFFLPGVVRGGEALDIDDDENDDVDDDNSDNADVNSDDFVNDSIGEETAEGSDTDDFDEDERLFEEYQYSLEQELSQTVMSKSFERMNNAIKEESARVPNDDELGNERSDSDDEVHYVDSPSEIDANTNLVKYFLESHSSQLGGPGPASLLLSQLGVSLPTAPGPWSHKKAEETLS